MKENELHECIMLEINRLAWKNSEVDSTKSEENIYPIDALPKIAKKAVECIYDFVKAPLAIVANSVLFSLTFIAQKHINAQTIQGMPMPCSLYFLSEAKSGDRKTTADYFALKPILEIQNKQVAEYKKAYRKWAESKGKEQEPLSPKKIFANTTLEPLVGSLIREEYKNIALESSDGGDVLNGHNFTSETAKANMTILTKIFDNGHVERNRSKSNLESSGEAFHVRLSIHLMAQPVVIQEVIKGKVMGEIGLLPRFIFVSPKSLVGTRFLKIEDLNRNILDDERLASYYERCNSLIGNWHDSIMNEDMNDSRPMLEMSLSAKKAFINIYNAIEGAQSATGKFSDLSAEASRAGELILRLSTVFAFFEGIDKVEEQHIKNASKIVLHSLEEWLKYTVQESLHNPEATKLLELLLKKYKITGKTYLLKSSINQLSRKLKDLNIRDSAIEYLSLLDDVKVINIDDKEYVVLNPKYTLN